MRKWMIRLLMCVFVAGLSVPGWAYDFGDFRSETLVQKAWTALEQGDIEAVNAYVDKCLELYGAQARTMQASLSDFPQGPEKEVFGYWALNDVATILFIQGKIYQEVEMMDEAKAVYNQIINEFTYGQTWDPKSKYFWRPAVAAREKLTVLESGINVDLGDYSSSFLTTQAWKALDKNDYKAVKIYTDKVIELYTSKAQEMQQALNDFPEGETDEIHQNFWALNDVGTSYFIQGKALLEQNQPQEAKTVFEQLIKNFKYAQCWDPQGEGFFWKPSEAASEELEQM
ncbi:MAG: tetratricopeptide repeat protein [Candidatus Omnitrophota bacterium]